MLPLLAAITLAQHDMTVKVMDIPPSGGKNDYYVGNRAPLAPTPFRRLPVGTIKPRGWVQKQLELQANGFVGHLEEISKFLDHKNNAWLSPTGEGEHGWEEVPYWLKGFGDLGYVLDDKRIVDDAKFWLDHIMAGQAKDGWLGPRSNLVSNNGKPDMWPNMPILWALQSYYEYSHDKRVITVMNRYFKWQLALPEDDFYLSYWEKQRGGDNLYSVFWLYNRTGEPWLLDLAKKIHRRTAPWADGIPDWHGVNFAQAFREPAQMAALNHDKKFVYATEADYEKMRQMYGEVPGGMYGADENARPGHSGPRQATETCAMVEMMASSELLLAETGDPLWAERCEDVTFNSLPASMTADLKALHYLTAPNMPLADARSKSPGLQNSGPMLLFDPYDHRCCQHNVAQGWPYYAEHLWMATDGNGLGTALYAPCEVTATVGNGTPVTIRESTNYPFKDLVEFHVSSKRRVHFPLTLRLPSWCDSPKLALNGKEVELPKAKRPGYVIITRTWHDGDRLMLSLPMHLELTKWTANKDSVSVQRGPLTYSLLIKPKYVRKGGTDAWPAYEIHPASSWNYGLVPDLKEFKVTVSPMPANQQPFEPDTAPVRITAPARLIANWGLDSKGLIQPLQQSPAFTKQPVQNVTLIPMGAARIRISAFPTVSGTQGTPWVSAPKPKKALPATASHVFGGDTLDALSDGLLPSNSHDQNIPRFTWWDHKGTAEWVEYELPTTKLVDKVQVYWFDDSGSGECRAPESWSLSYWDGKKWVPVVPEGSYGTELDKFNTVEFAPVAAQNFRLDVQLQPGYSSGILEWILK